MPDVGRASPLKNVINWFKKELVQEKSMSFLCSVVDSIQDFHATNIRSRRAIPNYILIQIIGLTCLIERVLGRIIVITNNKRIKCLYTHCTFELSTAVSL